MYVIARYYVARKLIDGQCVSPSDVEHLLLYWLPANGLIVVSDPYEARQEARAAIEEYGSSDSVCPSDSTVESARRVLEDLERLVDDRDVSMTGKILYLVKKILDS